jgi:hypothetical protein
MGRAATPTPGPPSGFLNLSAVSQQARVPRPCFVPQPFLIAPFGVFPSQESCAPLEATGSLAVIHRRNPTSRSQPYQRRFHQTPTPLGAVAWIPRSLWVPFPRAEARIPVALDSKRRNRHVPPASPTSELCSPCESVAPSPSKPEPETRYSLGCCAPPEHPLEPRSLHPPSPRAGHPPDPKAERVTARTAAPAAR